VSEYIFLFLLLYVLGHNLGRRLRRSRLLRSRDRGRDMLCGGHRIRMMKMMNELNLLHECVISVDMIHTTKGFGEECAIDNR